MQNILKIVLMLFTLIIYGQEGVEVPLNSLYFQHPNGTYIRDFDDIYGSYIGTWKGQKHGKELTLQFVKFQKQMMNFPNGDYYYEDILKCKYEVKDVATNNIISTTMNALNYEDYKILGLGYPINGTLDFLFTDSICSNTYNIIIEKIDGVTNQLKYVAQYSDSWDYTNCSYLNRDDIPKPIPFKINMILTKQ